MKETDQLTQLFESLGEIEQLNEFFFSRGEAWGAVLMLNIFQDMGEGDREEEDLDEVLPFRQTKDWQRVERKYKSIAKKLAHAISRSNVKLTDEMVTDLEDSYYEGSDSYDSLEYALDYLPELYDRQIQVITDIIKGNYEDEF